MKREEWLKHHKTQQASKLTVIDYCKKHKISESRWYSLRVKYLGKTRKQKQSHFITPIISESIEGLPILLRVGKNIEIEFPSTINAITLATIAKAISEKIR